MKLDFPDKNSSDAQNNKRQTFDMYLHKTNDCARPYEKLANISGLLYQSRIRTSRGIFPKGITPKRKVFWQPIAWCPPFLYFYQSDLCDLYLNLKLSIRCWVENTIMGILTKYIKIWVRRSVFVNEKNNGNNWNLWSTRKLVLRFAL